MTARSKGGVAGVVWVGGGFAAAHTYHRKYTYK
jgi:ribosomal protein L4